MTARRTGGYRLPWPRSLAGQLLLVAALALFFAQGVNLVLMLEGRSREAAEQATSLATVRIAEALGDRSFDESSRRTLGPRRYGLRRIPFRAVADDAPLPPGDRLDSARGRAQTLLGEFNVEPRRIDVLRIDSDAIPAGFVRRGVPLAESFPGGRDRFRSDEVVLVAVTLEGGRRLESVVPIRDRDRGGVGWLIGQTVILYLALLIPLALFAWALSRPLARLTERARRFSGNDEAEMLAEQGPDDIRRLIAAFNAMQSRVGSLLGEKDVMLGAIGHDLKTPLASLRLRLESIEIDAAEEVEREKMIATVEEMHAMLEDILTLARLGRSSEAAQPVDLSAMLAALADDYADRGAPVAYDEEASGDCAPVRVRPLLVRRALRNLIDNALLYGGEARLQLKSDKDEVHIRVADKGPGLPAEEAERLFEPFTRAENSRNRASGGSGLGLTIARAIARAHGGEVRLDNSEQGGLIATLSLLRR